MSIMNETKEYLVRMMDLAASDFRIAMQKGDDGRAWDARREISRIERTAAETFGFAFADELHGRI